MAVRRYLLECDEITIVEMKERFFNEYGWAIKRYGQQRACIEWLQGLPIGVDFTHYDIIRIMADWLDETVEQAEAWLDKRGDELYWQLLAREILASK